MNYMLAPLDRHLDQGFGAMADAFKEAADLVISSPTDVKPLHAHLPVCFLYRHAVELYLKSGIIIFHRRFQLPYGDGQADGEPYVPVGAKWKKLFTVHDINILHEHFRALVAEQVGFLTKSSDTNWTFPAEFDDWMSRIAAVDNSSSYFRYPVTRDAFHDSEKSIVKTGKLAEVLARVSPEGPKQKIFLVIGEGDETIEAYYYDRSEIDTIVVILKKAAEFLCACHGAMCVELTGGW